MRCLPNHPYICQSATSFGRQNAKAHTHIKYQTSAQAPAFNPSGDSFWLSSFTSKRKETTTYEDPWMVQGSEGQALTTFTFCGINFERAELEWVWVSASWNLLQQQEHLPENKTGKNWVVVVVIEIAIVAQELWPNSHHTYENQTFSSYPSNATVMCGLHNVSKLWVRKFDATKQRYQ